MGGHMKTKQTSAAVTKFLDSVSKNILSNISIENYFSFNPEKKITTQYLVLKMLMKSVGVKINLNESALPNLLNSLKTRNEEIENYEFAEVLKNMESNMETLMDMGKTNIKPKRTIKTNKPTDA